MKDHNSLSPEVLANRQAQNAMLHDAAVKGDPIAGAVFELESLAHQEGLGFIATTGFDYRDEDDLDDLRPY